MKLSSLFLFVFSTGAFAQENFKRIQYENDWFRDYSREEMSARFGETRALLPFYACDGKTEFDPFFMPSKNPKKNSLKIQLYKEEGKLTYQNGLYFTADGEEITEQTNIFLKYVAPAMEKLEKVPELSKLLRHLEQSPYPLTIAFGGNSFNPKATEDGPSYKGIYRANAISILTHGRMTSEDIHFEEIGAGGIINWDPKDAKLPNEVTLAHEMFHALDSVRGTLDMRFIQGEGYEAAFVSEYRAVFFENIARQAAGIELRTHYGNDHTGPGVLDAEGKPRFISSPCLK